MNYDENTIVVREETTFNDISELYDTIDEVFRVGKHSNKSNNILNRNIVILFENLKDSRKPYECGWMALPEESRKNYANSVKDAFRNLIKGDPLVLKRVRHGYYEYIDDTSEYFNDKQIDDCVKIGRTLKFVEVFTPLCMVAHRDEPKSVPHCHILYITHNVRTSLFSVLNEFNNDANAEKVES